MQAAAATLAAVELDGSDAPTSKSGIKKAEKMKALEAKRAAAAAAAEAKALVAAAAAAKSAAEGAAPAETKKVRGRGRVRCGIYQRNLAIW